MVNASGNSDGKKLIRDVISSKMKLFLSYSAPALLHVLSSLPDPLAAPAPSSYHLLRLRLLPLQQPNGS